MISVSFCLISSKTLAYNKNTGLWLEKQNHTSIVNVVINVQSTNLLGAMEASDELSRTSFWLGAQASSWMAGSTL